MKDRMVGSLIACFAISGCEPAPRPLIPANMIDGDAIAASLAPEAGDAARGRDVFVERERGHCVICHALASVDAPFQGNVGPSLTGIGERLSAGQIRLRIAQPSLIWPDTVMPSYYRRDGLNQVGADYIGQTILSAQEIEDLVAFLSLQRFEDEDDDR